MTEEKKLQLKAALHKEAEHQYPGDPKRQNEYMWRVYQTILQRKEARA